MYTETVQRPVTAAMLKNGRWETGDASLGHPCYELVMGRQGLPFDKAVPACLQAGAGRWQQERDIYNINVSNLW